MISEIRNKTVVSILIPIHNRIEVTKKGLYSINQALSEYYRNSADCNVHYDVVVIDDGSLDGSFEYIEKYYPQYTILKGDGNLWWSGSINKAVDYLLKKGNSTYILLWNDDTYPDINYFIELSRLISNNYYQRKIIGSLIYEHETRNIWSFGGKFNPFTGRKYMLKKIPKNTNDLHKVDWLPGMGTVIPYSCICEVGQWDEKLFPQYHGDIDFTLRAKKKGFEIVVSRKLIIYNFIEYSSYSSNNKKEIINSLKFINSRYNLKKNILFYHRHTITPLWMVIVIKNYIKYFLFVFKKLVSSNF